MKKLFALAVITLAGFAAPAMAAPHDDHQQHGNAQPQQQQQHQQPAQAHRYDGHRYDRNHWQEPRYAHHRRYTTGIAYTQSYIGYPYGYDYVTYAPPPPVYVAQPDYVVVDNRRLEVLPQEQGDDEYCREYTKQVKVAGRTTESFGTVCMQPDGAWKIVN